MSDQKQQAEPSKDSFWRSIIRGIGNPESQLSLDLMRWILVGSQAITVILTWSLWCSRSFPPNLPMLDGALDFDVAWLVIGSLLLALVRPTWGVLLHVGLIVIASMMDQIRIQPQLISCSILLLATLPYKSLQVLGRVHLLALWFYGGFHKAVSSTYMSEPNIVSKTFEKMTDGAWNHGHSIVNAIHVASPWLEILIAVLLLFVATRKLGFVAVVALHASILGSLLVLNLNNAVWSWNVAVVAAAFALFWGYKSSLLSDARQLGWAAKTACVVLVLLPLAFYGEFVYSNLCHCLYSNNKASGFVVTPGTTTGLEQKTESIQLAVFNELNVPLPSDHGLFEQYFLQVAEEHQFLYINDKRPLAEYRGRKERWLKLSPTGRRLVEIERPGSE